MNLDQIRQDVMFLAGKLAHRGAQTHQERRAAEYIRDRFRENADNVEIDDFHTSEGFIHVFASYYSEFLVVCGLAIWWPRFALIYGLAVFITYLAEFMGNRIFSLLLPRFETQNVEARFTTPEPQRHIIVHAYYDSGGASLLSNPDILPFLRTLHQMVLAAMVIILGTLIAQIVGDVQGTEYVYAEPLRWFALSVVMLGAITLFFAATHTEDIRGANANASGVAALLRIANKLKQQPLKHTDVTVVATGSHEVWMSGMHHLLSEHRFNKKNTYILNLECVGAGKLHYLAHEGFLHNTPADKELLELAKRFGDEFQADPAALNAIPTAAHFPLTRSYKALTLMALDEEGLPVHWNSPEDRFSQVEEATIAHAADLAEKIMRELDQKKA